jgi:excinuclease ABC subunit C
LEANLIHSQQPKYNVSLKDDKSYTYVRITQNDEIPGVFLSRQKYDPRSLYFGPYTKKYGIEQVLRVIRQVFPYCLERKFTGKPCQYVGLHQCDGICEGKESKEDYKLKIDQIVKVLSGHTKPVKNYIENKMKEAVKQENYALASLWRDRFSILNDTVTDQKVVLNEALDIDLLSLVLESQGDGQILGSLFYQSIREGKVNNVLNYLMSGIEEIADEIISNDNPSKLDNSNIRSSVIEFLSKFILSFYYKQLDLPDSLFIQVFYGDKETIENNQYKFSDEDVFILQELLPIEIKIKAL